MTKAYRHAMNIFAISRPLKPSHRVVTSSIVSSVVHSSSTRKRRANGHHRRCDCLATDSNSASMYKRIICRRSTVAGRPMYRETSTRSSTAASKSSGRFVASTIMKERLWVPVW